MKKYYISSKTGTSGICKYSHDFYELILKEKGYVFIDSNEHISTILPRITLHDHVHIELGIFQKQELNILTVMLTASYNNIAVTLHDPPLLKYPFHEFSNSFINKISKFYDLYINRLKASKKLFKKIRTIYVLSTKGRDELKKKYGINNVFYLPHIINEWEIESSKVNNNNFIYLGFIGKNKGIEYSLQLHQSLLNCYPEIQFYIIGMATGKAKKYYEHLKKQYQHNVHFMGYLAEEDLKLIFEKTTFALMPFKNYKFYSPFSGSLLYSLKKGKIPFTTSVNAIPEVIENGVNGYYLTGKLKKDSEIISRVLDDTTLQTRLKNAIYKYLILHHTAAAVEKDFNG